MTEFDENQLEQWLREAIGAGPARFDAEGWRQRYARDLAALGSEKGTVIGETRHRIAGGGRLRLFTRLAGMAAMLAFVVLGGWWLVDGDNSSRLFAQTLQQLQQRSYGFTFEVEADGAPQVSAQAMVAEPGRIRFDQTSHLGEVSTIVDVATGESTILFHRQKAAYVFAKDPDVPVTSEPLAFLILPGRSIVDLWSLQAGDERSLGRRVIDGREVEGFEVVRTRDGGSETIQVWSDTETGMPELVKVDVPPDDARALPAMTLRLEDFDLSVDADPSLFAMKPEGYTQANRLALAELLDQKRTAYYGYGGADDGGTGTVGAGTLADASGERMKLGLGRGIHAATAQHPEELKTEQAAEPTREHQVIQMFQEIEAGQYDAAIGRMRAIDWTQPMTFVDKPLVLVLSEMDAIALTAADRQKVVGQAMVTLKHVRAMSRQAIDQAAADRKAGQQDEAEALLTSLKAFGRFLQDNEDRMLIVQLMGIAIEQQTLEALSTLYQDAGRQQDYEQVEARRTELEQIRKQITN